MGRGTPMQPSLAQNVGFFQALCQISFVADTRPAFFYFLLGFPWNPLCIWGYYRASDPRHPRSRVQQRPPYARAGQPKQAMASRGSAGGVTSHRGSDGMPWIAGAAMASRGSDGQPGQRWPAGAAMASRGSDGQPGQRWHAMDSRGSDGQPGQRWHAMDSRGSDGGVTSHRGSAGGVTSHRGSDGQPGHALAV
jgi:hypothetical protein